MKISVRKVIKRVFWTLFLIAFTVFSAVLFSNRQIIADILTANAFDPTTEIEAVESNLNLTKQGNRIFYATEPQLEERAIFNANCQTSNHTGEGALLGCYVDGKIHLFQIEDERLMGIVEVTAGHELLHAVYDRMSHREREHLQKKLLDLYDDLTAVQPDLEQRLAVYANLSQARLANEMHSVFGTEVADLPEWLEEHYAQYFSDREIILEFYDSYRELFQEIQDDALSIKDEIDRMTVQIDMLIDEYTAEVLEFNHEWDTFNKRNEAFEFSKNPAEFYAKKEKLDLWREEIEQQKTSIEEQVEVHENLRKELQELNHITQDLQKNMDSAIPETN